VCRVEARHVLRESRANERDESILGSGGLSLSFPTSIPHPYADGAGASRRTELDRQSLRNRRPASSWSPRPK
jgi:hypothetical protein